MGLFTAEELEKFSIKFLCGLYRNAGGNLDQSLNSINIYFNTVSTGAYERPSYAYEAARALVLELKRKGLVETWNLDQEVRLTSEGLVKCREICR